MRTETEVGPLRITRVEQTRRDGGTDTFYDLVVYSSSQNRGPTAGTALAVAATATEVQERVRELILCAAEVHRFIRDHEDPQ